MERIEDFVKQVCIKNEDKARSMRETDELGQCPASISVKSPRRGHVQR